MDGTTHQENRARLKAAGIALGVGVAVLAVKTAAFAVTGSVALRSDALEGCINCLAAAVALWSLMRANEPADREHPYGHGKFEQATAAFEGGLVLFAGLLIAYDAVVKFEGGNDIHRLDLGLLLNAAGGAVNGVLGLYLRRQGRRLRSPALAADGVHVLSDFYVTIGIAAGLGLVLATGIHWIDSLLAGLLAAMLLKNGIGLVKDAFDALTDREDPELLARLVTALNAYRPPGVITVHQLRTLRSGRHVHVDVHVVVPNFYRVDEAHAAVSGLEQHLMLDGGIDGELHDHVDPCLRKFCAHCEVSGCPERQEAFTNRLILTVEQAVAAGTI